MVSCWWMFRCTIMKLAYDISCGFEWVNELNVWMSDRKRNCIKLWSGKKSRSCYLKEKNKILCRNVTKLEDEWSPKPLSTVSFSKKHPHNNLSPSFDSSVLCAR